MEKRKKEIFFQTPLFPPVKSWKMKGLLGINYRQHLADEEDYADAIPVDQEGGGDTNNSLFILG